MPESIATFTANMEGLLRTEVMDGEEYLVAPVILITTGVHNGILYTEDELSRFPQAWNGVPVPVYHPAINGVPVSANIPLILEQRNVGRIFNAYWDAPKLKAEVWINKAKADAVDPRILAMLADPDCRMDVSTGMWLEEVKTNGQWQTERYRAIAQNIRPDHLALLPDVKGACSWEDGGGLPRLNADGSTSDKWLTKLANQVFTFIQTNLIHKTVFDSKVHDNHLQAGSDPSIIIQAETEGGTTMEREPVIACLIASGDWAETDREFLANLTDEQFGKVTKGYEQAPAPEAAPDAAPEVPAVNAEPVVEPEAAPKVEPEPVAPEAAPKVEPEPVAPEAPVALATVATLESYVQDAPEEFRGVLENALALYHNARQSLVDTIVASQVFTANELAGKSNAELQKLATLAQRNAPGSFDGRQVPTAPEQPESRLVPAPKINWKDSK